jgi:hypothetical protein
VGWRVGSEAMFYSLRHRINKAMQQRVEGSTAKDERPATGQLEQLRGKHSLDLKRGVLSSNVNIYVYCI